MYSWLSPFPLPMPSPRLLLLAKVPVLTASFLPLRVFLRVDFASEPDAGRCCPILCICDNADQPIVGWHVTRRRFTYYTWCVYKAICQNLKGRARPASSSSSFVSPSRRPTLVRINRSWVGLPGEAVAESKCNDITEGSLWARARRYHSTLNTCCWAWPSCRVQLRRCSSSTHHYGYKNCYFLKRLNSSTTAAHTPYTNSSQFSSLWPSK